MKYNLKTGIIRTLYFGRGQSCHEISVALTTSIPVVAMALSELITEDFVTVLGHAPSSGGRRPLIYGLKPNNKFILAVAMDQLSTRIGILDMCHNYVSEVKDTALPLLHNNDAAGQLAALIKQYLDDSGISHTDILGAGIGMPGFVNVHDGINYTYLPTAGINLVDYLEEQIRLPVYIDNDSSLIALAELYFGFAKRKKNAMVINIGWGIGLGMVLNGTLFRGHNGFAGEFSHIPLAEGGALCGCGKQGCLEAEASMLVVTEKAIAGFREGRTRGHKYLTGTNELARACDMLIAAAHDGDIFAGELLTEAGFKIGKALAILIHLMNPERIILGGRGATVGDILIPAIQRALAQYCIPRLAADTALLKSELGFEGELIGAAILVMENPMIGTDIKRETVSY